MEMRHRDDILGLTGDVGAGLSRSYNDRRRGVRSDVRLTDGPRTM